MPLDLSIPATAKMTLFVEDPVTRDYLHEVWQTPIAIAFRLGGGNDGVRAIVQSFEQEGHPNVFGIIDRDFRPSNTAAWQDPAKTFRTFVLPVHEIKIISLMLMLYMPVNIITVGGNPSTSKIGSNKRRAICAGGRLAAKRSPN